MSNPLDVMEGNTPTSHEPTPAELSSGQRIARRVFNQPTAEGEDTTPNVIVENPVPTPAPAPVKQKFVATEEYQVTDENGKPIGAPTILRAESEISELDAERKLRVKIKEAHQNAVRGLKNYRDKYRTMETQKPLPEFKPRDLTAQERIQIRRKMDNPETMAEGWGEMFQAMTGVSAEQYRQNLEQQDAATRISNGRIETQNFIDSHPEYVISPENQSAMFQRFNEKNRELCVQNGVPVKDENGKDIPTEKLPSLMKWCKHNLDIIYEELVSEGAMTLQTGSEQETTKVEANPPVEAKASGANTPDAPATRTRLRGTKHSGMGPSHASVRPDHVEAKTKAQQDAQFLAEVRKMPKAELQRRIKSDKQFRDRLDSISLAPR